MYDRLLLATDGSDRAMSAAEHAVGISECCDATLHVLYVVDTRTAYDNAIVEPGEMRDNLREEGQEALAMVEEMADERGIACERSVREGIPAECIEAYVEEQGIDHVFLGEHGRSPFETVLLGSTAEAVLYRLAEPVTVV